MSAGGQAPHSPRLRIGTSGWHYPHWRGPVYPPDVATKDWLAFYSSCFPVVELNNTFYRLPTVSAVRGWKQQTPPGFVFALKASRLITHMRKLRGCGEALAALFGVMDNLGEKLGPILFQLPPRWRVDHRRLEEFIRGLPAEHRYSFEFRDLSWHDERVYELLSACNVALCHYHLEGFESPAVATADFGYWRLHGPGAAYRGCYSDEYLGQLSDRLKSDHDQYVFFDNDEAGYAVRNALRLQALCDARRD